MKVKVFQTNSNGKIEFTPAELEKLLNDTYEEGQRNCNCTKDITWINPYITPCCDTITTNFTKELSKEDMERVTKEISNLVNANRALRPHEFHDVFTSLAKELNF